MVDSDGMTGTSLDGVVVPTDKWSIVNVDEDMSLEVRRLVVEEVVKYFELVGGRVLEGVTLEAVDRAMTEEIVDVGAIELEVEEGNGSEVLEATLRSLVELEEDEEGI